MGLFPKGFDYFDLFEAQVEELMNTVEVLKDMKESGQTKKEARKLRDIEHKADCVAHEIFLHLNKTFITPIDREDIALLAHGLDDIIDEIEKVVNRLDIYKISPIPSEIFKCYELIEKAVIEVSKAVKKLRDPKKRDEIRKHCEIINFIENEADDLEHHIIGKLFDEEKDPILIMKLKEIYDSLERVTDRCEDVANAIETIVAKNY